MNKQIIAAVLVIGFAGVVNAWTKKQPITRVILGAYVLLLILSLMDLFGGPMRRFGGALAMLAVVYVLINQFPWSSILGLLNGPAATTAKATTAKATTSVTLNAPSKLA